MSVDKQQPKGYEKAWNGGNVPVDTQAKRSTDVTLWHSDDCSVRVFRTENGEGIGICAGGKCIVKTAKSWIEMAWRET